MALRIFKYIIDINDSIIELPRGAKVLHIGLQRGEPHIWALIDDEEVAHEWVIIHAIGTGHLADGVANKKHLGTLIYDDLGLVYHYFIDGDEQ